MAAIIASVEQGQLRGKRENDIRSRPFYTFLGVPYAKPPLGELRFKAPQPPEPWKDIRDATCEASPCYSLQGPIGSFLEFKGAEDCLYLNVYTHQLGKDVIELKPVMFYIHGGAFTVGSGSHTVYGPKMLMTEDVVLVVINYRLGALGFLSIEGLGIENAGCKDMIQALKWANENIEEFGGDPNNITIFGESAGGAAVHYLVLSPLAKGLFHKAIAHSGSALNPWARGRTNNGLSLAKILGYKDSSKEAALKFLRERTVEELLEGQYSLGDFFDVSKVRYFSPTVEPSSKHSFLPEDPIKTLYDGNYVKIPLMMGCTSNEGLIIYLIEEIKCPVSLTQSVPFLLGLDPENPRFKALNSNILQFYFGRDEVDETNREAIHLLAGDIFFVRGIHTSVKAHAQASTKPVYYYEVSVETALNYVKQITKYSGPGVCHGDDISYLFSNTTTPHIIPGSEEDQAVERCVKMWTNFARCGKPTPDSSSPLLSVKWKPVDDGILNYLEIGNKLQVGVNPNSDRMLFWDSILSNFPYQY